MKAAEIHAKLIASEEYQRQVAALRKDHRLDGSGRIWNDVKTITPDIDEKSDLNPYDSLFDKIEAVKEDE